MFSSAIWPICYCPCLSIGLNPTAYLRKMPSMNWRPCIRFISAMRTMCSKSLAWSPSVKDKKPFSKLWTANFCSQKTDVVSIFDLEFRQLAVAGGHGIKKTLGQPHGAEAPLANGSYAKPLPLWFQHFV